MSPLWTKPSLLSLQTGFLKSRLVGRRRSLTSCQVFSTDICWRYRQDAQISSLSHSQGTILILLVPHSAGLAVSQRVWWVMALVFRVDRDDDDKDDVVASVCVCRSTQGSPRLTETCYLASSRWVENLLAKVPLDRVCWNSQPRSTGEGYDLSESASYPFSWKPWVLWFNKSWACVLYQAVFIFNIFVFSLHFFIHAWTDYSTAEGQTY